MNIFILDETPVIAAKYHCDQHINKMILESAQMLCTTVKELIPLATMELLISEHKHLFKQNNKGVCFYKPSHVNHPCNIWLRQSLANCNWLLDMCYSLQAQLPKIHDSAVIIKNVEHLLRYCNFPSSGLTEFALAMPDEIKYNSKFPSAVEKYQVYYKEKALDWKLSGKPYMSYSKYGRETPAFIKEYLKKIYGE